MKKSELSEESFQVLTKDALSQAYFTKTSDNNTPGPVTAVIILTYMRSGSSLTGDILQHSPGAFYVFEPLHYLGNFLKSETGQLIYANGTIR